MSDTKDLRDRLLNRLIHIVDAEEELAPAMVSACVNFLKAFPPAEPLDELPAAKAMSETLAKYKDQMPFRSQ